MTPHQAICSPAAADAITLVHTDGTTATVPYTAGTGWTIPTSPAVAEIDIPQFAEEGSNTTTIQFFVYGYAAPSVSTTSLLTNTATANAYLVGTSTPVVPQETASSSVMAVSPDEPSGTVVQPDITPTYNGTGTCTETITFGHNGSYTGSYEIEVASAPSQAIYVDYLAPAGARVNSGQVNTFTFGALGGAGGPYTAPPVTATVTNNYNGTGRTLLQWVIPAGIITQPGVYVVGGQNLQVYLGAGCDGTFQNDLTVGYGAVITGCLNSGGGAPAGGTTPPSNPTANPDLRANGSPIPGNYCGDSEPLTVAAVNPAFVVDKSVQGNLDAAPVTGGGIGDVSPDGGTASYDVTFTNSGESNLANPVMYDLLPAVGDTYATSLTARGSQFPVTLTGVGPVPSGVTVYYSTAANPCRPQVLPTNPGCVSDWTTTPPSPLSSVTALEFTYTGTVYVTGAGINSFSIPLTVSTPNGINGETAWNTIGTTANAGTTAMTPAESSRTGLQAALSVLGLVKSVTSPTGPLTAAGQTVSYAFQVTNNSAVQLTGLSVTDTQAAPAGGLTTGPTCPQPTLAPGASETCAGTYVTTQADIDNGSVDDTATAAGTPPSGSAVTSPPSVVSVPVAQATALTVAKTATPAQVNAAGNVISYSFAVTNAGNVTLTGIAVKDTPAPPAGRLDGPVTCRDTTLAPSASTTCTATYTVTQADMDHGSVDDTATVSGTSPSGVAVTSPSSAASVTAVEGPAISIVKSASVADLAHFLAGQAITYTFVVTNTGNVTLAPVTVTDTGFTGTGSLSAVSCPDGGGSATVPSLAPGTQATCTATYTLTTADVDAGTLSDTGNAAGTPPTGPDVTAASLVTIPAPQNPALTIAKAASPVTVHAAGDLVSYSFKVTNTGNTTLHGITVNDTQLPPASQAGVSPVTCPDTTLAPGQFTTCTATYTVTQADIDHGDVSDSATASGTSPSGASVTSSPADQTVTAAQAPAMTVVKSTATASVTRAGQRVPYTFLVTDTGNVTLQHVAVTDTVASPDPANLSPVTCPDPTLAPGAHETCTATYTATHADIDHGRLGDSATVTGTPPATPADPSPSPLPPSAPSAVLVPAVQHPGISLVKSAVKDPVTYAGEVFRYSFLVGNTGNVTLRKVGVSDVMLPPATQANLSKVTCPHPTLAPGASMTCTATYTATAADVAHGSLGNTAVAFGTPPSGVVIRSRPHTISVTVTGAAVLIPTGEGAAGAVPGASPGLAAAGTAALAAGMLLLTRRRTRRRA